MGGMAVLMRGNGRTTTELTTSLSQGVARFLGLATVEGGIEVVVRAVSAFLWL